VEYVKEEDKLAYLLDCLQKTAPPVLVFAENKRDVDAIHEFMLVQVRSPGCGERLLYMQECTLLLAWHVRSFTEVLCAICASCACAWPACCNIIGSDICARLSDLCCLLLLHCCWPGCGCCCCSR
jgi:hypothetical protein